MKEIEGKTLKPKGDLTLVSVEDSGALLDVEKRSYYELNDTAFFLLKLMEEGCRYERLHTELTSEFHVDQETAWRDIDEFLKELIRRDLLGIGEEEGEQKEAAGSGQGGRIYHAPVLEYQQELAVACAAISFTPDVE
jgi:hypothetical protein